MSASPAPCETHQHCGCCGQCSSLNHQIRSDGFCNPCHKHLAPRFVSGSRATRLPWDRTYFALTGEDCPYQVS